MTEFDLKQLFIVTHLENSAGEVAQKSGFVLSRRLKVVTAILVRCGII